MSLDTKYRPLRYADVLGQEATIKVVKEYVKSGHGFRQSYVFAGGHGGGKTTLGRILARALLCEKPVEGEPCDQCLSCTSMLAGKSEGFIEVDAATNSGKEHVKRITEEAAFGTYSGQKRLYLFDECFTEDTMLITPEGPKSIRDLVESQYDGLVASYQRDFEEICWQPVTDWYEIHDERECLTLEFDNGVILTVTTDQEIFTLNRGWVPASGLTDDDEVCDRSIASIASEVGS